MDENKITELEGKIQALEKKVNDLYSVTQLPDSFMENLQKQGFIRDIGPEIITYVNPAGKELKATFIKSRGNVKSVSLNGRDYYTPIASVNISTDTLNITNNPASDGTQVLIASTGTPPGGLGLQNFYYVINSTSSSLKLSLTPGGAAINITSIGTGQHYISAA